MLEKIVAWLWGPPLLTLITIAVGGPGAVFWMWMAAPLGIVLKMAEVSLAVYYRNKSKKNRFKWETRRRVVIKSEAYSR